MYNELAKKQIPAFSLPKEEALARLKDAVSPYLRDGEFKNPAMGKIPGSGIVFSDGHYYRYASGNEEFWSLFDIKLFWME